MNNDKNVLELKNVIKSYRQGKQNLEVLTGVNLEIKTGDIIALVGQSGAGKSTMLQIAGLLDKPTSGKVILDGINVSKVSDDVRTNLRRDYVGFVYQYHNLLSDFTALENVMLPMIIANKDKKIARDRAVMLLEKMHLTHRLNHRPAELSGGEQQRVALARALVNNPSMIIADEPTGNLEPVTAWDIMNLLNEINLRGTTVVIATHAKDIVDQMKKRVIEIEKDSEGKYMFYTKRNKQ